MLVSPVDAIDPIVYLDCIVVKIRQDKQAINKAVSNGPRFLDNAISVVQLV